MSVVAHKVGPGQLTFGAAGTASEWGGQCTKIEITPDFKEGDITPTLDGSTYAEDDVETWKIAGTILESYDATSLLKWSWDNRNVQLAFTFKPNDAQVMEITGTVKIRPLGVGGEVKTTSQRDFEFTVIGEPVMAVI